MADELRDALGKFWQGLRQTDRRASCPRCGVAGLEVREASTAGGRWSYVWHCGDVQVLYSHPGESFGVGDMAHVIAGILDDYDECTGMIHEDTPLGYVVRFDGDPATDTFYWPEQLQHASE